MIVAAELDPVGFVAEDLTSRGALVEGALALVPPELGTLLQLPETVELEPSPAAGGVFCGLGSPLLDRLVADASEAPALAAVRWAAEPPRAALAESLAARVVVRNGVSEIATIGTASATYVLAAFAWQAEADDRYRGLGWLAIDADTGAAPDASALAAFDRALAEDAVADVPVPGAAPAAAAALARRVPPLLADLLIDISALVARRRDREAARVDAYFDQLVAETRRPVRRIAPAAVAARLAALESERTAKRGELALRYALRSRAEIAALISFEVRVAEVTLRVRRRKASRELAIRLPPGARLPDLLPCAGCTATTLAPVLCDDAMHLLCEVCAPEATGRPRCPACAPRHQVSQ